MPKVEYTAMLLGATGNVGGRILHLLVQSPLCKQVLFHWAMPSRYHSIHKNDLARAMVAQSEQAFLAFAQGKGPAAPAVKILEYKEMELFFVAGDCDAP